MSAVFFCASLRHGDGTALSFAASDLNIVAMAVATPAAFVDGVVLADPSSPKSESFSRSVSKKPCATAAAGCSLVGVGGVGCNAVRYVNGSNGATQAD